MAQAIVLLGIALSGETVALVAVAIVAMIAVVVAARCAPHRPARLITFVEAIPGPPSSLAAAHRPTALVSDRPMDADSDCWEPDPVFESDRRIHDRVRSMMSPEVPRE